METRNPNDAENNRDEVKASTLPPLKPGDICYLMKDEQDIELIPAGTKVMLTRQNGKDLWYCRGVVNGVERPLLVFATNLSREKVLEATLLEEIKSDGQEITFWQKLKQTFVFYVMPTSWQARK